MTIGLGPPEHDDRTYDELSRTEKVCGWTATMLISIIFIMLLLEIK